MGYGPSNRRLLQPVDQLCVDSVETAVAEDDDHIAFGAARFELVDDGVRGGFVVGLASGGGDGVDHGVGVQA